MSDVQDLKIGEMAYDGTVYAGHLPTGERIFVMPKDVSTLVTFNQAARIAATFNQQRIYGHDDWQLPTVEALQVMRANQNEGALKNTFNASSNRRSLWHKAALLYPVTDDLYISGEDSKNTVNPAKGLQFSNGKPVIFPASEFSVSCRLVRVVKPT